MLIVALVFTVVFLFRDVQVLAVRDRSVLTRFAGYAVLLVAAVALMAGSGGASTRNSPCLDPAGGCLCRRLLVRLSGAGDGPRPEEIRAGEV